MNSTFLTIAIPTYNRLQRLRTTVSSLCEQVRQSGRNDIEVVVSDNCSTDQTQAYLEEVQKHTPFLRVHRNTVNIGAEPNFYLLPQLASGRYLFMIGDDDVLETGALQRILAALADDPDYLIVNFDSYDNQMEHCFKRNVLEVGADATFAGVERCLEYVDTMTICFLSMWVAKKEFFNVISEDKYCHYAKWGMSILADRLIGITHYAKGKIIAAGCLKNIANDRLEMDFYHVFICGGAEAVRYAVSQGFPADSAQRLLNRNLRRYFLKRIFFDRRVGPFDSVKVFASVEPYYRRFPLFWLMCVPVMFVPGLGTAVTLARKLLGRTS